MSATLAEIIIAIGLIALVYRLLRPVQRWLEARLLRFLAPRADKPVIDVTNESRKK